VPKNCEIQKRLLGRFIRVKFPGESVDHATVSMPWDCESSKIKALLIARLGNKVDRSRIFGGTRTAADQGTRRLLSEMKPFSDTTNFFRIE